MKEILLVGAGGFVGAVLRYLSSGFVLRLATGWKFPAGTFAVNVLGCLVAGMLMALGNRHSFLSPGLRLLLFTGILGGFTTFSAFGVETVHLLQQNDFSTAGIYVIATLIAGFLAFWLGSFSLR